MAHLSHDEVTEEALQELKPSDGVYRHVATFVFDNPNDASIVGEHVDTTVVAIPTTRQRFWVKWYHGERDPEFVANNGYPIYNEVVARKSTRLNSSHVKISYAV